MCPTRYVHGEGNESHLRGFIKHGEVSGALNTPFPRPPLLELGTDCVPGGLHLGLGLMDQGGDPEGRLGHEVWIYFQGL